MKNFFRAVLLLLPMLSIADAGAEQGWAAKVQAVNVDPDVKSSLDGLDVDSNVTAVLNLSYFFDKSLAIEVLACCYTRHEVNVSGLDLGKVSLSPPTVTAQYHLPVSDKFIPYVGLGFNYSRFFDVDLNHPLLGRLQVDKNSTGAAFQLGFNVPVDKNGMINFDVKKIKISTTVTTEAGAPVADLDIDPLVIGVGYSWRF